MKLTTKSEYALLALIYLARNDKGNYIKLEDICMTNHIPAKYLEQIFINLKQMHLINARRGACGGYRLARSASEISVAEIVRIMDGHLAPSESSSKYFYAHTPLEKEDKIMEVLRNIRDYIANKLEELKLSDLV
jgi:Rrf2 family transcriptional regulator, cysteine metabolism repressor